MPFLAALFSAIGNRLGSILQTIFGWSVTALFGQLPRKKQIAVSGALLLSVVWPILLLGIVWPSVAAWTLAFVPLERWLGPTPVRILWIVLAVIVPLGTGVLVHFAAPVRRMSAVAAMFYGYPLAAAFCAAFLITAVTVPLVKLHSMARRWSDEHVYVLARPGAYRDTLRDLVEACTRAHLRPEVSEMPLRMTLAAQIIKLIGRRVAAPMVAVELHRIRADNVELYLYPSDLLIRGKPVRIAAVRAMMTMTGIERHAHIVSSDAGQRIQDEIGRLSDVIATHRARGDAPGATAGQRLAEIWDEMNGAELPFQEWTVLETLLRRLERHIAEQTVGKEAFVIDRRAEGPTEDHEATAPAPEPARPAPEAGANASPSTAKLVDEAFAGAAALVRTELAIAKADLREDVREARQAAIGFAVAGAAGVVFIACAAFAAILALGATPWAALAFAAGFLVLGCAAGFYAYRHVPSKPLERSRRRMEEDLRELKEHVA